MNRNRIGWGRRWLLPIVLLSGGAWALFVAFYTLDHLSTEGASGNPLRRYINFEAGLIADAVSALAGMIAAVLGIVITVVSIIVQLSADRYTGVAQMFMRDRTNIVVMVFYVVACVCSVWLSMSLHSDFVPRYLALAIMAATSFGLVLMLPYFAYVFWFLEPANIIDRIRMRAVRVVRAASHARTRERCAELQAPTLSAMEELTDITSNSISGKDKIIASRAVDALRDLCLDYLRSKHKAHADWFCIGAGIAKNPDFVAMDPESLRDLETQRTWVEWKILRQYLGIYNEALTSMRDINYLIAIDTRYVGEAAGRHDDDALVELSFRFMNSYLRSALNARDVRTAYNVLNQYRILVESMLRQGKGETALEGLKYMKYYGQTGYNMNLTFVAETVAYDVSALCQLAHELDAAQQDEMLAHFLDLDQPLRVKSQEKGLLGVRKAQVKLAAYYLLVEEEDKARLIASDMHSEPAQRLAVIRDQLERVESKDFWEIIDRGRNFEYMPPAQRAKLDVFFGWLGIHSPRELLNQPPEEPVNAPIPGEGLSHEGHVHDAVPPMAPTARPRTDKLRIPRSRTPKE
ncbi:DUF2254 family protein [Haliangium ochraceum]|uniref:DUF2254 domain-containing protein n=1 Tax=Haliangium ochraceum (strain DSM 14365 / JCM 11303 / SMP-2) TaxID=502025 RepID=D0LQ20_HALO1|nr:DUF2254 family protein [Haliangium ochraceum]ACY17057.1 conserved hypothetical protein [Haliangium ochraceum DSM 14365]